MDTRAECRWYVSWKTWRYVMSPITASPAHGPHTSQYICAVLYMRSASRILRGQRTGVLSLDAITARRLPALLAWLALNGAAVTVST